MSIDVAIFWISALVAVVSAALMIGQRNPVASVLYLIVSMAAQAVLYIQLGGLFMGAILVIVYAGAILVLFLFVIMLLNLRGGEDLGMASTPLRTITKFLVTALLVVELVFVVKSGFFPDAGAGGMMQTTADNFGSVQVVAELLFTKYFYAFELTSILLIAAIVGAVVMAKKERLEDSGDNDAMTSRADASEVGR
ncbi:MAG: NADH-quinone oxidoreductase subunit J [bacterium]